MFSCALEILRRRMHISLASYYEFPAFTVYRICMVKRITCIFVIHISVVAARNGIQLEKAMERNS